MVCVFIAAAYVVWPVMRPESPPDAGAGRALRDLQALRDRHLQELKDLELDRELGKLSDDDYRDERAAAEAKLAAVLHRLDEPGGA